MFFSVRIGESNDDVEFSEKALNIVKEVSSALMSNYEYDIIKAYDWGVVLNERVYA